MIKEKYLMPIWIDIKSDDPLKDLKDLNEFLEDALADFAEEQFEGKDGYIEISWSVNKHMGREAL